MRFYFTYALLVQRHHKVDWAITHDYHFGGYAKSTNELREFCVEFEKQTQTPLEPVYSGKLFYALYQLTLNGYFPVGSRVLHYILVD
jgi:1-aminocyclopropane-1-carboxylate deaminase